MDSLVPVAVAPACTTLTAPLKSLSLCEAWDQVSGVEFLLLRHYHRHLRTNLENAMNVFVNNTSCIQIILSSASPDAIHAVIEYGTIRLYAPASAPREIRALLFTELRAECLATKWPTTIQTCQECREHVDSDTAHTKTRDNESNGTRRSRSSLGACTCSIDICIPRPDDTERSPQVSISMD